MTKITEISAGSDSSGRGVAKMRLRILPSSFCTHVGTERIFITFNTRKVSLQSVKTFQFGLKSDSNNENFSLIP
jgi:hypothetical protein